MLGWDYCLPSNVSDSHNQVLYDSPISLKHVDLWHLFFWLWPHHILIICSCSIKKLGETNWIMHAHFMKMGSCFWIFFLICYMVVCNLMKTLVAYKKYGEMFLLSQTLYHALVGIWCLKYTWLLQIQILCCLKDSFGRPLLHLSDMAWGHGLFD